jgi:hypothetical protein
MLTDTEDFFFIENEDYDYVLVKSYGIVGYVKIKILRHNDYTTIKYLRIPSSAVNNSSRTDNGGGGEV